MSSRWLQPFVYAWNLFVEFKAAVVFAVLIFTAVTSFIIGVRMRREIKKTLGRKATDEDLADIDTWIEVKEAEEKFGGKNPE
ncbi:MAG: hypothetical protein P4L00_07000 [Candidatus Acidoferrales bacterium]|nr:hypothetical protein [Candidatus Acidoferrales bacterium]